MRSALIIAELAAALVFATSILIGLLFARIRASGMGAAPLPSDLTFSQMHHAYLGALAFLLGLLFGLAWLLIAGLVLTADDAEEHLVQLVTAQLTYQSPLHRLWYVTLGRIWPFTLLGRWLDQRLR